MTRMFLPAALLLVWTQLQAAGAIPLRDFARLPEYTSAKISPHGEYLALTMPVENQTVLIVLGLKDRKPSGHLRMSNGEHIADYWWVGPQRLVGAIATQDGSLETPQWTGELVGVDADGRGNKYLFGYRGGDSVGSRINRTVATRAFADMIDPLPGDASNALIAVTPFSANRETYTKVYKMDVRSGALRQVAAAPAPGPANFVADHEGEVRYVVVTGEDHSAETYWRERRGDDWKKIEAPGGGKGALLPLSFSADGKTVYFSSRLQGDRYCLTEQTLGFAEHRVMACDDNADLDHVITRFDGKSPIAAVFEPGYPRIKRLPDPSGDLEVYLSLMEKLGGGFVQPVSATIDGSQVVVQVYSDRNPGAFYLLDRKQLKVEQLAFEREWIDPEQMAERRPFSFKARDGRTIWGYLTLPNGVEARNLPLIVRPHGGPFGVRDHWAWDADSQMLASRGYAVLQVNFRGSGGYGDKHYEGGRYQWGGVMIDDILDATRWVIEQKIADPQRMCTYGGSYGAYAALMSAIREPDWFKCVIGYAGAYDLKLLADDSDIPESRMGRSYIREFIGKDDAALAAQSPVNQLASLKAPVLIVHGEKDWRTPLSQAKALRKALDSRKHPYEWLVKSGEGHGFYKEENRLEFYERMLKFLKQHLPAATPPAAARAD